MKPQSEELDTTKQALARAPASPNSSLPCSEAYVALDTADELAVRDITEAARQAYPHLLFPSFALSLI